MTFIGTFTITLLSVLASIFLIGFAHAWMAGLMFATIGIGALVAMYKIATEVDNRL